MSLLNGLCILSLILVFLAGIAMADTQEDVNPNISANVSPMIFSFSKASPTESDAPNMTVQKTDEFKGNESIEAYYNDMSEDVDMTLPRLNFLGIPMECHMC